MEKIFLWAVIIGALAVLLKQLQNKSPATNYREAYQRKQLLTNHEKQEYLKLKQYADARNLLICPKVRLFDLIEPKKEAENRQTLKNKIQSKHVDFVICNQEMEVVCIIELDDKTHLRQDRIARDQFVDEVLHGAGYRVIHTWSIEPDIFNFMNVRINHENQSFEEWKAAKLEAENKEHPEQ